MTQRERGEGERLRRGADQFGHARIDDDRVRLAAHERRRHGRVGKGHPRRYDGGRQQSRERGGQHRRRVCAIVVRGGRARRDSRRPGRERSEQQDEGGEHDAAGLLRRPLIIDRSRSTGAT
ncbi:hypothetical protein FHY03_002473 [Sphingomonas sp. BK345]|nr:hypothetical protein [Sphingomonas sp. BK345]